MKIIFYDVDTQNDFMNKDGALYVPDAEEIKPALAQLTRYACKQGIPIFGSVDKHFGTKEYAEREKELQRNGGPFPDHCMDGTGGQKKIKETRYRCEDFVEHIVNQLFIEDNAKPTTKFTPVLIEKNTKQEINGRDADQYHTAGIFFEKQHYDVATNPWFEKVIKTVAPERAIVYGVATDYCVKAGALALQNVGVPEVYVVIDAIRGITPDGCKQALEEMAAAGVRFTDVKTVLDGKL